jgi:hypothetical protein
MLTYSLADLIPQLEECLYPVRDHLLEDGTVFRWATFGLALESKGLVS